MGTCSGHAVLSAFLLGAASLSSMARAADDDSTLRATIPPARSTVPGVGTVALPPAEGSDPGALPVLTVPGIDWKASSPDPDADLVDLALPNKPPPAADRDSYFNTPEYQHLTDRSTRGHESTGSQAKGAGAAIAGAALAKGIGVLLQGE